MFRHYKSKQKQASRFSGEEFSLLDLVDLDQSHLRDSVFEVIDPNNNNRNSSTEIIEIYKYVQVKKVAYKIDGQDKFML